MSVLEDRFTLDSSNLNVLRKPICDLNAYIVRFSSFVLFVLTAISTDGVLYFGAVLLILQLY